MPPKGRGTNTKTPPVAIGISDSEKQSSSDSGPENSNRRGHVRTRSCGRAAAKGAENAALANKAAEKPQPKTRAKGGTSKKSGNNLAQQNLTPAGKDTSKKYQEQQAKYQLNVKAQAVLEHQADITAAAERRKMILSLADIEEEQTPFVPRITGKPRAVASDSEGEEFDFNGIDEFCSDDDDAGVKPALPEQSPTKRTFKPARGETRLAVDQLKAQMAQAQLTELGQEAQQNNRRTVGLVANWKGISGLSQDAGPPEDQDSGFDLGGLLDKEDIFSTRPSQEDFEIAPLKNHLIQVVAAPVTASLAAPATASLAAPATASLAAPATASLAAPVTASLAAPVIAPVAGPIAAITAPIAAVAVPAAALARSRRVPRRNSRAKSVPVFPALTATTTNSTGAVDVFGTPTLPQVATVVTEKENKIPTWAQTKWITHVLPSLYHRLLCSKAPFLEFSMDGNLVLHVQAVLDAVYPGHRWMVEAGDPIFKKAVQRLIEYRGKAGKLTLEMVEAFFETMENNTPANIADYVAWALPDGPALFGIPVPQAHQDPTDPLYTEPNDIFESTFILVPLATYLKPIKQSVLFGEMGYPYGALALIAAGVERAFTAYKSGVKAQAGDFSQFNIGNIVTEYMEPIKRLSERRWTSILRKSDAETVKPTALPSTRLKLCTTVEETSILEVRRNRVLLLVYRE
ncbi:hypothetical protein D9757_012818 [Collybiopsis confluens]|uniref:Uncharacterized protein n=1 Tax=Collybiopsis confluens TaxID=2823264 RepID=A0A8H5G0G9_9AGAR|nr:hypothetical protein D9757_012818 [Collybiopsis confluens]